MEELLAGIPLSTVLVVWDPIELKLDHPHKTYMADSLISVPKQTMDK